MIYLGNLGRMISVGCPSEQRVESAGRYAFQTTLEGRVVGQARPIGRRTWDMRLSRVSSPAETSKLTDFTNGAWGPGPFRFIPTEAATTNLLPPDVALCKPNENPSVVIFEGGPMQQPDGSWAANSYMSPNPDLTMFFGQADGPEFGPGHAVPVLPGGVVTAAVTLLGDGARADLRFYDFANEVVASADSTVTASVGSAVRSVVSAPVPDGAVSVKLRARSAVQGSRPQLTWTDELMPWADGRGCVRAVVLSGQSDLVRTGHGPSNRTYEGVSFTVKELG